jgi:hypothetical protein
MIVARHEVPGNSANPKSRPVGYGMIRAGAHRFDDWSDESRTQELKIFMLYGFGLRYYFVPWQTHSRA